MMKSFRKALGRVALACLASLPAWGATVANLYEASVPIDRAGRDAALQEALRTVAVRASGRRDAAARLGSAINNPKQYMRFESTTGAMLTAGFDSASVDKLLADAGLSIWGKERPLTVVWLQIQEADGAQRWVTSDYPAPEREIVARAAQARGLPIVWPRNDAQEQSRLGAATRDAAALLESAATYGANAALFGRARREAGGGFSVQWMLAAQEGSGEAGGGLDEGVHLAADTFARTYAASAATLTNLTLQVSGLSNLDAYATTLNYLEGLTLVRSVALDEVAGDTMRFRLTVRGDATTLQRAIGLGTRLAPASSEPSGGQLAFRYQP